MLAYTDGYLYIDGIKIHYYRTGDGKKPPFVLLHGATDNGLCWTPVAEWLGGRYDVIMPDAQGHGLSDRLGASFTFNSHTAQAVGLTKELGLKKPLIMGHSMGAGTAANIAIEYPDLPKAIILEDPAWGVQESAESEHNEAAIKQRETFRKYLGGLGKRTLEEVVAEGRAANPRWSEAEIMPWAAAKQQFDLTLFSKPLLNQRSYAELVSLIKCPTLLIIAESGIVSKEVAENAAKLWKSKQPFKWVQIKGAGHNIRREQFEEYKNTLTGFLQLISA